MRMADHFEIVFSGYLTLMFLDGIVLEFDHLPATQTNHMVVMRNSIGIFIIPTLAVEADLLNKSGFN